MPYDPVAYSARVAELVNRGSWRRANKSRVWGISKAAGYEGVSTADRINHTAIAERVIVGFA